MAAFGMDELVYVLDKDTGERCGIGRVVGSYLDGTDVKLGMQIVGYKNVVGNPGDVIRFSEHVLRRVKN